MGKTPIEWTDTTWNPTRGCARVSPGCKKCYAERTALRQKETGYKGLVTITNGHPSWTGEVLVVEHKIEEPLGWKKPQRIFVDSMSDLFYEKIPDWQRDRIVAVMVLAHWHTFQVLTKRGDVMRDYWNASATWDRVQACMWEIIERVVDPNNRRSDDLRATAYDLEDGPPVNIWLGVSVEDRLRLERIEHLRQTEAYIRFVSFEPLLEDLGIVDLTHIDWAVFGGESGPEARPMEIAWPRSLMAQCRVSGTAPFMKQVGSVAIDSACKCPIECGCGLHYGFRDRKGGDPSEWPLDLRVREYPCP